MKKIIFLAALIMTSVFLTTACAPKPPSQVEISSANYGRLPNDYQQQIKNYMASALKDPESARYTFEPPFKAYSQDGSMASTSGGVIYGHASGVQVNAKHFERGRVVNPQVERFVPRPDLDPLLPGETLDEFRLAFLGGDATEIVIAVFGRERERSIPG